MDLAIVTSQQKGPGITETALQVVLARHDAAAITETAVHRFNPSFSQTHTGNNR